MPDNDPSPNRINRRGLLKQSLAAAAAGGMVAATGGVHAENASDKPGKLKGRIKQSIVQWCFNNHWKLEQTCEAAKKLGVPSIELVGPDQWDILKKHGLTCAITGSHSFVQGMNNPRYHDGCIERLKQAIDDSADAGVPTVITFTGFARETGDWNGGDAPNLDQLADKPARIIDADQGIANCVAGYKKVVGHAEKKGVNISLEMLNSRVDEQMKGHPGYQGDHTDYCMEIIRQVGSPRFGLLFDIYHVQIMDGDIIRRLRECKDAINHVHTAGNPGRRELDDQQEINYPPIMRALLEIGYEGFVGQEFIPTGDPLAGLADAVKLCDVS